VLKATGQQKGS